jgi:hypothetical protein
MVELPSDLSFRSPVRAPAASLARPFALSIVPLGIANLLPQTAPAFNEFESLLDHVDANGIRWQVIVEPLRSKHALTRPVRQIQ